MWPVLIPSVDLACTQLGPAFFLRKATAVASAHSRPKRKIESGSYAAITACGLRLAKQQPPAVCHGVAHLFVSARALAGEQAHNTEASRPDWANPPPTPAAILARSVRPAGSPSSLYGAHIRRASISVDSLKGAYSFPMHNPRAFFATWDVRHSCQPPRRHGSRGTGKIGSRAIGCKPCSRNQRSNGGCLPRPEFHHEDAPRRKQAPRLRGDRPISVEAVQAAVERDARELAGRWVG